jgi:tetratricopeptide (TPR) repeat protein
MGLTSEAISAFQTSADGFHKQGKKREALELLRRMATIDPTNTTSRIKVAEVLRQEDLRSEAVLEYEQVAQELERQGDVESLAKVYKRVLEIEPDNTDTLVRLSRNLLARGSAAQAEPFAIHALEIVANEPDHYELLAEVYRAQSKDEEMSGVYRRLAELYRERGDEDRARDIQQRYVPAGDFSIGDSDASEPVEGLLEGGEFLDGDDATGDEILLESDMIEPDAGSSLSDGVPGLETDEICPDPIGIPELKESATPVEPILRAAPQITTPPALSEDVDAEQLLAEASVYLRYGKRDKAIAHLEQILAGEPDHRLALEKLGEAYVESGEHDKAVEFFMRSVRRAQEDDDGAAVDVLRARIAALDATAAASLDPQPEPPPDPEPDDSLEEEEFSPDEQDADDLTLDAGIDADAVEIDIDVEEDLEAAEATAPAEQADAPPADEQAAAPDARVLGEAVDTSISAESLSSSTTQQIFDDLEEADFYMQQGLLDEAEGIYKRVLAVAPNHPRALARLGEVAAERGSDQLAVETPSSVAAPAPQGAADETTPEIRDEISLEKPEVAATALSDDLADLDIDDAMDVEASTEGAVDTSIESRADAPLEGDVITPGAGAESVQADEPAAPPPTEPASALGDGFDLAAELSGALEDDTAGASFRAGTPDDGFAAVFEAFKQGVSETVSEGDHETHYDLGIAYKEMGLLDDAIQEFRVAMQAPSRRVECLHLVGLCALEAGRPQLAVENFTEQLEAPDLSEEHKLAGRFELGRAYRAMGNLARARSALEAVAAVDPNFCDVGALLDELAMARPSGAAPEASAEGGYESFEDVVFETSEAEDEPEPDPGETFEDLIEEANADEPDEAAPGSTSADGRGRGSADPAAPRPKRKKKISFV